MTWRRRIVSALLYLVALAVAFAIGYWLRDVVGP